MQREKICILIILFIAYTVSISVSIPFQLKSDYETGECHIFGCRADKICIYKTCTNPNDTNTCVTRCKCTCTKDFNLLLNGQWYVGAEWDKGCHAPSYAKCYYKKDDVFSLTTKDPNEKRRDDIPLVVIVGTMMYCILSCGIACSKPEEKKKDVNLIDLETPVTDPPPYPEIVTEFKVHLEENK